MKVLVTGSGGFIGSNIIDALIKKNFKVIGKSLHNEKLTINPQAKFYETDIRNFKVSEKIFSDKKPDFVIHTAQTDTLKNYEKS